MELLWAVYKFFRINKIDLKCSFVRGKDITSHDEMAPPSFTSQSCFCLVVLRISTFRYGKRATKHVTCNITAKVQW